MQPPVLVINLERSAERWQRILSAHSGIEVRRIPGVDGSAVPPRDWRHVAFGRFQISNGRNILPGEYGCYRSHLRALATIAEEDMAMGVIVEDDVQWAPDMPGRAMALLEASGGGVMKLINHRVPGFVRWGVTDTGEEFGRCVHGPQGSAACYAVTKDAALRLLESLAVMWLPWDVALERGWDTGVATFTARLPLAELQAAGDSTIASRAAYRTSKLPAWRRVATGAFRAEDALRRAVYARLGP